MVFPDHPFKILIIGGSGSGKTNVLLNLINMNDQIMTKFTCMSKMDLNQVSITNGREKIEIKELKNLKAFIGYSQNNWCLWTFRRL